jgi:hypothetical protein
MPSRRHFLRNSLAAATAAAAATGLYTWRWEPEWLEITHRDLPIDGLPPELEGRTLAHLSDLHVGPHVEPEYVAGTFARAAALSPDIVVMTGDWITYRRRTVFDDLGRLLEHFPRGRLGTFGILGNHDYGYNWSMIDVADRVTQRATEAGVQMLRDASAVVQGLEIVGLEDFWGPRFAPASVLAAGAPATPRLVLCHNPDVADLTVWGGYRGWILSGHTHGGQCKPPFLPPPVLPVRNKRYTSGAITVDDRKRLYISRGIGYVLRVRFNVRPEVAVFTLRRADGLTG